MTKPIANLSTAYKTVQIQNGCEWSVPSQCFGDVRDFRLKIGMHASHLQDSLSCQLEMVKKKTHNYCLSLLLVVSSRWWPPPISNEQAPRWWWPTWDGHYRPRTSRIKSLLMCWSPFRVCDFTLPCKSWKSTWNTIASSLRMFIYKTPDYTNAPMCTFS